MDVPRSPLSTTTMPPPSLSRLPQLSPLPRSSRRLSCSGSVLSPPCPSLFMLLQRRRQHNESVCCCCCAISAQRPRTKKKRDCTIFGFYDCSRSAGQAYNSHPLISFTRSPVGGCDTLDSTEKAIVKCLPTRSHSREGDYQYSSIALAAVAR
jgi:hypothetical protein